MTIPYKETITYGPILSRRLGRSLGINLLPLDNKICSFNCIYCQYGRTRGDTGKFLKTDEIIEGVEERLKELDDLDHITLSGNGEPMLHPDFSRIVQGVISLRDRYHPLVPIALLTNGTEFKDEGKRKALDKIDKVIVKIDTGCEEGFKEINRPLRDIDFQSHIETIQKGRPNYIQSLFIKESLDFLDEWFEIINTFRKICEVQIYTLDRPTEGQLTGLTLEELKLIAGRKSLVKIRVYHRGI
ncbi:MAG TPA: radical SAM protein [bacterium (Candidatus Stahlbacteria)]|nr:radical SAM protein [Candidatus Stahlbacteria bacterium]